MIDQKRQFWRKNFQAGLNNNIRTYISRNFSTGFNEILLGTFCGFFKLTNRRKNDNQSLCYF